MAKQPDFTGWSTVMGLKTGTQHAPQELLELINELKYKEGWQFTYRHEINCSYLVVGILCVDSTGQYQQRKRYQAPDYFYDFDRAMCSDSYFFPVEDDRPFQVIHTISIPPEAVLFDSKAIRRWLMDQIINVETHEACEFFDIPGPNGTRYKPFFPHSDEHGPYKVVDKTPIPKEPNGIPTS